MDTSPQDWQERFSAGAAKMVGGSAEVIYDKPGEREPSQDALIGLQRFIRRAEYEVLSLNPYLVPGEHDAYSRTRLPMLRAGVDVYEMKYHGGMQHELDTPPIETDFVSLHAKAVVLDRRHVFIGSYNFSPRSRNLNTEMGILVDSPEFGEQVAVAMERSMSKDNAWRLRENQNGELSWESENGTLTTQPSQNFWRRFQNTIFGLFPLEEHL